MKELHFRELDRETDRDKIWNITRSSGLFEPREVDLAMEYFAAPQQKKGELGNTFLLADLDGITVGYSNYGRASCSGNSYYLHWIAVDDAFRGRGLGKIILTETERMIFLAGGRKLFIETASKEEYLATQKFYESASYTVEAKLKDFYNAGDDQLIYSKILTSANAMQKKIISDRVAPGAGRS